jgi:hypothetical protein
VLPDAVVVDESATARIDLVALSAEHIKEGAIVFVDGRRGTVCELQKSADMTTGAVVVRAVMIVWADDTTEMVKVERLKGAKEVPWCEVHMGEDSHTCILCSTPEFGIDGQPVMVELEQLCATSDWLVFGYDWGGSSTAEAADADPTREVPD